MRSSNDAIIAFVYEKFGFSCIHTLGTREWVVSRPDSISVEMWKMICPPELRFNSGLCAFPTAQSMKRFCAMYSQKAPF